MLLESLFVRKMWGKMAIRIWEDCKVVRLHDIVGCRRASNSTHTVKLYCERWVQRRDGHITKVTEHFWAAMLVNFVSELCCEIRTEAA
jgi:hypothetical protein